MKKISTLILILHLSYFNAGAQCVPDPSYTVPGIYPDSATGLPHAIVGQPYLTDMQLRILTDTIYLGLPAIIDSIRVTGVTGIPAGFSYSCTPSRCTFPGGSNACLQITGAAPTAGMVGVYPLIVNLTIFGRVLGVPQSLNDQNDNYRIVIDNNTGVLQLNTSNFKVGQNAPNPFRVRTEVEVFSPGSVTASLKIADMLGNLVRQQNIVLKKGNNLIQIDARDLSPGLYMYSVQDGKNVATRRMIVTD